MTIISNYLEEKLKVCLNIVPIFSKEIAPTKHKKMVSFSTKQ